MKPPAHLGPRTAERFWITHGPNSGGVRGWYLWQGYLFAFEREAHAGSIESGIPIAEFCRRYRDSSQLRVQQIVEAVCDKQE